MDDVQIRLSATWAALMFIFLLGDVLRVLSGNFKAGEVAGRRMTQSAWLAMAVLMVIPPAMIVASLMLPYEINRWANIGAAAFFFVFNLMGLPTYPSLQDKFLTVVGLVFNGLTIWSAWNWAG